MAGVDPICVAEAYWDTADKDGISLNDQLEQAVRENPRNASLSLPTGLAVEATTNGSDPAANGSADGQGSASGPTASAPNGQTNGQTNGSTDAPRDEPPEGALGLAAYTSKFWAAGSELRVQFQGGTEWQHAAVRHHASRWSEESNIFFTFGVTSKPDILVSFDPSGGNWSRLGTDSRAYAQSNQSSLNLANVNEQETLETVRRKVIHEFGHALGAVHEHQSPRSTIKWNKDAVYKSYEGPPNNWDKATIDSNILEGYSSHDVQATAFDPDSIMLYAYPKELTLDGNGTHFNSDLSARDVEYMRFCYPPAAYDARQFSTLEIRPWWKPQATNTKEKYFYEKYAGVPQIALGLTSIDMDEKANIRITAKASEITTEKLTVSLNTWDNSTLYSASINYLELGPRFSYLQTGTYNISETRPWSKPQAENSKRITFAKAYSAAPNVVVWLNALDMDRKHNWRIKARATDVDKAGFTLHLDSWGDSVLYTAGATWIAYPAGQAGVASGRFSTNDIRKWSKPRADNVGRAVFAKSFGGKVPKIMMALDELDYKCDHNLRVRLGTSQVSSDSMYWHLQSWEDSVMYAAGASYFGWV